MLQRLPCANQYLQAVQKIAIRYSERISELRGYPFPIVKTRCAEDQLNGDYLEVTQHVFVDGEPVEITYDFRIDDQIDFTVTYSGGAGFGLLANDIETYHIQITRLSQLVPQTLHAFRWAVSIDPHDARHIEFPPKQAIPLYIYRQDNLPQETDRLASTFIRAVRDLNATVAMVYQALYDEG